MHQEMVELGSFPSVWTVGGASNRLVSVVLDESVPVLNTLAPRLLRGGISEAP